MPPSTMSLTRGICLLCGALPVMKEEAVVCRTCFEAGIEEIFEERQRAIKMRLLNLLEEIFEILRENKKNPRVDVRWVGSMDGSLALTWDEFELIAKETNYHSGYGSAEIAMDLVVVGKDWWLERGEYDGSEWWEFKRVPEKKQGRPFMKVMGKLSGIDGYVATGDLEEINKSWEKG